MEVAIPYTRLSRRIRALILDSIFLSIGFFITMLIVKQFSIQSSFIESLTIFVLFGSIEPLFVSVTGSSIGHYLNGLRVRRATEDKNLNLFLSYLRFIIKIPLGVLSLVSVLITRQHQALHDLISDSIIVHKTSHSMPPDEVLPERTDNTAEYIYPSKTRRAILILLHIFTAYILVTMALIFLSSDSCLNGTYCSDLDTKLETTVSIIFLIFIFVFIWLGWQGRLYGCRRKSLKI